MWNWIDNKDFIIVNEMNVKTVRFQVYYAEFSILTFYLKK